MARMFRGVIFQTSRQLRVMLQKAANDDELDDHWVPSVVCISQNSFDRLASFDMVRFISHKYGFGTYMHMIKDYYSATTVTSSKAILKRLLQRTKVSRSNVYVDTLISPSYTTAVAQVLQLPGISGQDNNMILFEFSRNHTDQLKDIVDNYGLIKAGHFDLLVLESTEKGYGYKHEIHVWLTAEDYTNANFMILLAYIILGHPEWKGGQIKIFAVYPESEAQTQKQQLLRRISEGRLAISPNNIEVIARKPEKSIKSIINATSVDADLVMVGFSQDLLKHDYEIVFTGYDPLGNMLFVNTDREKVIS